MEGYKFQIAELLIRAFAGILFLFQGYDKLFKLKMPKVIDVFMEDAGRKHVPRYVVSIIAYYTSIIEFLGGMFLVCGFLTTYTLYALGLDLLLVCIAFSYLEPLWDMKHVFPRLLLISILLLLPQQYCVFCIDRILNLK